MPRYRCCRDVLAAVGTQEFEVEADSLEQAKEMFKTGNGELVADDSEVVDLGDYQLDAIWEE